MQTSWKVELYLHLNNDRIPDWLQEHIEETLYSLESCYVKSIEPLDDDDLNKTKSSCNGGYYV